jgi:hypothetical protein
MIVAVNVIFIINNAKIVISEALTLQVIPNQGQTHQRTTLLEEVRN